MVELLLSPVVLLPVLLLPVVSSIIPVELLPVPLLPVADSLPLEVVGASLVPELELLAVVLVLPVLEPGVSVVLLVSVVPEPVGAQAAARRTTRERWGRVFRRMSAALATRVPSLGGVGAVVTAARPDSSVAPLTALPHLVPSRRLKAVEPQ